MKNAYEFTESKIHLKKAMHIFSDRLLYHLIEHISQDAIHCNVLHSTDKNVNSLTLLVLDVWKFMIS